MKLGGSVSVEDYTQVQQVYDRSFTARFERALVKFLDEFIEGETGHRPGFHTERPNLSGLGHAVFVEARTQLPDSPGISVTATVVE